MPTALLAHYVRDGANQHAAAVVYTAAITGMGISFGALWIVSPAVRRDPAG